VGSVEADKVCTGASEEISCFTPIVSPLLLRGIELLLRFPLSERLCQPEARESVGLGSSFISASSAPSGKFGSNSGKMHIPTIRDKIKRKVPAQASDDSNGKRIATPRMPWGTTKPRSEAAIMLTSRP